MEVPVKKYFRMFPGGEVRLKGAYIVRCEGCDKDADGNITAVRCTVDMDTRHGSEGANRKVKGTLHWVSATANIPFEARLYEPLLLDEDTAEAPLQAQPQEESDALPAAQDFLHKLNPRSVTFSRGYLEEGFAEAQVGDTFQFLRMGYFCMDKDSTPALPVFNRVVGLRDTFKKALKA